MKLAFNCMQCFQEMGMPSLEFNLLDVNEDGIYRTTCSKGHRTLTVARMMKYEFLLDLGFLALRDGYAREAIANFAAAVERFYEFYVRVISIKFGISGPQHESSQKPVYLSERKLGAFVAIYMIEHLGVRSAPMIDKLKPNLKGADEWVKFRNNVIHNGYLPTKEEALAYGEIIYQYLFDLCEELMANNSVHFNAARAEAQTKEFKNDEALPVSSMGIVSILVAGRGMGATFEHALNQLYIMHDYINELPLISNK